MIFLCANSFGVFQYQVLMILSGCKFYFLMDNHTCKADLSIPNDKSGLNLSFIIIFGKSEH